MKNKSGKGSNRMRRTDSRRTRLAPPGAVVATTTNDHAFHDVSEADTGATNLPPQGECMPPARPDRYTAAMVSVEAAVRFPPREQRPRS